MTWLYMDVAAIAKYVGSSPEEFADWHAQRIPADDAETARIVRTTEVPASAALTGPSSQD